MNLNDLSESQQELLHPLIKLKTNTTFDSLIVLRDVFTDLSVAYNTFSNAIKDVEDKLSSCYTIASSGVITQEATEALLLVRGNLPNSSNIVQAATAEQTGLLRVMETMLNVIKRVRNESDALSLSLDKSVSCAISTFANQYIDTFDMDGNRLRRDDDLSTLISNLRTFKHSQGYPLSPIRKHVDNVLKAFKEFQHCLNHERESLQAHASDLNSKSVRKAKSRTLRAKVSLNKYIQELFDVAPDIRDLNDSSLTVPIVSKSDKKAKNVNVPVPNNLKFHNDFYKLEQQRLELLSSCLQIWVDNFIRSEKGIYSQLEILWDDILKFSPGNDFHKFENLITGTETTDVPKHSRILIPSDPGPINDYTTLQLNTYSQCPTPINDLSDVESEFLSNKTEKVQSESNILRNADKKLPKNGTENLSSQCMDYPVTSVTSPDFTSQKSPDITSEIKDVPDTCMISEDGRDKGDISRGQELNENDVQEKVQPGSGNTSVPIHVSTDIFPAESTDKNEPKVKALDRMSKNPMNPIKVSIDTDVAAGRDGMEPPMNLKGVTHYLKRTRERFDDYMIKYYNLYNDELLNWSTGGFDWLNASIEELMTTFEYHHVYPFDIHTQSTCDRSRRLPELSKEVIPMPRLKCTFEDSYMTNEQWCILSLEIMIMTHRYISGYINHPCISTSGGDSQLREYLLLNLGILENILIKIRRMIEVFRNRLSISLESYSILDILLKPRDAFTDNSPHICIHIMDVRYRVLLLIDSISKAGMLFNDRRLSDTLDYYQWFYRQLHLVHLSLIQKLIRLIHRIDSVDISVSSRWYKIINSTNPLQDLKESFKFVDAKKLENICNRILSSICFSIGSVNSMKSLVIKKLNSDPKPLEIKEYLLQLLESMLDAEESDYELGNILEGKVDQDTTEKKNKGKEIKDNTRLSYKDFVVDTSIYEDDNISVLAEIKQRKKFCMRTCRPLSRYNMVKYIVDQVISDNRDMKYTTNKYFKRKIDLIPLSRSWALEVPIILRIVECLHQYLSCDELCFSDVPGYFQGIVYITSFMQTGILPNFNLLKKDVKTDYANDIYQIPISAHSILASMAFWTLNVCSSLEKTEDMSPAEGKSGLQRTSNTPGKLVETEHCTRSDNQNMPKSSAKEAEKLRKKSRDEKTGSVASDKDQSDFYKRMKLKELGIEYESKSKRLSELTMKQLFLFNQVPANMYYLPKGIGSLDAYLLFDFKRFISNNNLDSELLLPDYTLMNVNGLEFVDWSSTDKLKKLVKMQLKGMYLDRTLNKVHLFMSDLLNYHIPRDISSSFRETDMYESLLIPSSVEREILAILYLRCTTGKFRNEIFDYLCKYVESVDPNALFYLLSLFNIFYALLFNITSHHSAVFDDALLEIDYDRNRGLPLINIYRLIVAQNAKLLVKKCVEHVKEVTEGTEDGNVLLSHYLEDVTQMLRHECASSSNVWNNFLTFGEYPSLLANCCMVELKRTYYRDDPGIGLIMPNVMKFMVLQREFDVSYLIRTPAEDPNIQASRLLRCMFFSYFNPNLLVNGSREVLNSIKNSLVRALESKFHEVNDIVKAGLDSESWKRVNDESLHSTGAVDLFVVLQYSLRASFDLAAPTEWLILPFTNACESALESYFKNLVKLYSLKNLYALYNFVNSDPSERADSTLSPNHGRRTDSSCPTPVEGNTSRGSVSDDINRANEQNHGATILIGGNNEEFPTRADEVDDSTSAARSESKSVVDPSMTGLRDAEDISASVDNSIHRVFTLLIEDELAQIPMDKKKSRVWKTIKSNLLPKMLDFPGHLQEYVAAMGSGNVMQDLIRVWNLEYISQQLIRMPDEISGYYYNQIRQRDDDYLTIHRLIGTIYESDPNNFFYFEPHQLVEMPHSRSSVDLTLAAQRLLKSTSTRVIKDLLVVVSWKLVFVDFKRDLFERLYTPTFQSWTLTQIIMKFPNTIYNFVNQIPKDYKSFCIESFLYIFVKAVSYVLHLKVKNYKLTKEDSKVIRTDINTLSQVLVKHSINTTLLNPLENYTRN